MEKINGIFDTFDLELGLLYSDITNHIIAPDVYSERKKKLIEKTKLGILEEIDKVIDEIDGKFDVTIFDKYKKWSESKQFFELVIMINKKWNSDLKRNIRKVFKEEL